MTIGMKRNLIYVIVMSAIFIFGTLMVLGFTVGKSETPQIENPKEKRVAIIQQKFINIDKTHAKVEQDLQEIKTCIRQKQDK